MRYRLTSGGSHGFRMVEARAHENEPAVIPWFRNDSGSEHFCGWSVDQGARAGRERYDHDRGCPNKRRENPRSCSIRSPSVLGGSLCSINRGREPLHASGENRSVDECAGLFPGRAQGSAGCRWSDFGSMVVRQKRAGWRGLPHDQCLYSRFG